MRERLNILIKQTVRKLRHEQTEAEAVLWPELRNRKLLGKKFLRQHPLTFDLNGRRRFFVTDFYCHEAKLVIEVDGGIHERQKDYDRFREYVLQSMGFKIVRFKNKRIENDLESVLAEIKKHL